MRKGKFVFFLLAIAALLAAAGCREGARVGDLQTRTETVEQGDADSVITAIDIGAGDLTVSGGANELLDATFTYNVEEIDPQVTYSNGRLDVKTSDVRGGIGSLFDLSKFRNEWDLQYGDDIPMEMRIDLGAGKTDLTLGSLALSRLDISAGAGEVGLDLSNSQTLEHLDFDMGAGEVNIDLSGDWQQDLDAIIDGGVGELSITLPAGVGVQVEVDTGVGSVNTTGLSRDGDVYTNDAYGESDVTLHIDLSAGVGAINLDVR